MPNIVRKSIRVLEKYGFNYGGWMHFPKPEGAKKPQPQRKLKNNEKILWCPWCGEWSIYKRSATDMAKWECQGWCGWGNTDEYYVKKFNNLWDSTGKEGLRFANNGMKKKKK